MSEAPVSISDLISRWPTIGDFAAAVPCGYEAARQMRRRNRIAPEHWAKVIAASELHGVPGVTYEWLAKEISASAVEAAQ